MTMGGWITMLVSVTFVTALFGWCVYRVLRSPADPDRLAHVDPVGEEELGER